jgi:hypothetical protein
MLHTWQLWYFLAKTNFQYIKLSQLPQSLYALELLTARAYNTQIYHSWNKQTLKIHLKPKTRLKWSKHLHTKIAAINHQSMILVVSIDPFSTIFHPKSLMWSCFLILFSRSASTIHLFSRFLRPTIPYMLTSVSLSCPMKIQAISVAHDWF